MLHEAVASVEDLKKILAGLAIGWVHHSSKWGSSHWVKCTAPWTNNTDSKSVDKTIIILVNKSSRYLAKIMWEGGIRLTYFHISNSAKICYLCLSPFKRLNNWLLCYTIFVEEPCTQGGSAQLGVVMTTLTKEVDRFTNNQYLHNTQEKLFYSSLVPCMVLILVLIPIHESYKYFTFCASSLEMNDGSMPCRMLYLDFQSFSSLEDSSQATKNSRELSISSPSKIQQLSILLMGW